MSTRNVPLNIEKWISSILGKCIKNIFFRKWSWTTKAKPFNQKALWWWAWCSAWPSSSSSSSLAVTSSSTCTSTSTTTRWCDTPSSASTLTRIVNERTSSPWEVRAFAFWRSFFLSPLWSLGSTLWRTITSQTWKKFILYLKLESSGFRRRYRFWLQENFERCF